jgi:hypothetical protein
MACSGCIRVSSQFLPPTGIGISKTNYLTTRRRRHRNHQEPHILAHDGRRTRLSTGLVQRPLPGRHLRQPGLWHRRPRQRTPKHVLPHGSPLHHPRPHEQSVPGNNLPPANTLAGKHDRQGRRPGYYPARRARSARSVSLLCRFSTARHATRWAKPPADMLACSVLISFSPNQVTPRLV